ncbi:hypothetical protein [Phenylobacterium sp.]|jgi:hypothetical protein|uniref:hypothetical protein n=1 Tax=Phenylobacterium sp. TaxID=1871053 RepID=UPI002F94C36E
MSMDHTSSPQGSDTGSSADDTPMFAPIPSWERGKKRRGLGAGRSSSAPAAAAATTATTGDVQTSHLQATHDGHLHDSPNGASMTETRPMVEDPYVTPAASSVYDEPVTHTASEPALAAPIGRTHTTTVKRKGGVPVAALAAGVVALGGLAAAGWYASQPKGDVATLTPGAPGEAAIAPDTTTAAMAAAAPPVTPAVPAATTRTTTTASVAAPASVRRTTTTRTASVRTRPAATAATGVSADASATLPGGPQPYADTGATAPTTVNPAPALPSTPPVEPAPAPSASSATPATPATPAPEPTTVPDASTTP